MVAIAQLVEHRIVIPVVAGSSPVGHPKVLTLKSNDLGVFRFKTSEYSRRVGRDQVSRASQNITRYHPVWLVLG